MASENAARITGIISNLLNVRNTMTPAMSKDNLYYHVRLLDDPAPDPIALEETGGNYKITRFGPAFGSPRQMINADIKLDSSGKSAMVCISGSWRDLAEIGRLFPTLYGDVIGVGSPFWKTACIWETSGKAFRLLDLPQELRDEIYTACATFVYPNSFKNGWNYHSCCQDIYNGILHRELGPWGSVARTEFSSKGRIINGAGPVRSLMLSSKKVSSEFTESMLKLMDFRFTSLRTMTQFAPLHKISRLSLDLSIHEWMEHLSIDDDRQLSLIPNNSGLASTLRNLRLSHLSVFFRHRQSLDYTYYPGNNIEVLQRILYMVMTGLVLFQIAACTTHIPKIEVTGCVSGRQEEMFQQFLDSLSQVATPMHILNIIQPLAELTCHDTSWWHGWRWNSPDGPIVPPDGSEEWQACGGVARHAICTEEVCLSKAELRHPGKTCDVDSGIAYFSLEGF